MFEDTYHTIAAPAQGIYKEKGSKFLAFAYPVTTTDEVRAHLDRLRKEYFDARHHSYAYILGPSKDAYRLNDVMRILQEQGITSRNQQFELDCRLDISVRQSQSVRAYDTLSRLYGLAITVSG